MPTRGIAGFRGEQLRSRILRDSHFDENNKINENKVNILFHNHREILEDTKVDVFVQSNDAVVAGLSTLDITSTIGGKAVATDESVEGVVLGSKVELRQAGSEDFPFIDADGDRVYGKLRYDDVTDPGNPKYFLDFFSLQPDGSGGEIETAYTFAPDAVNTDFRYVLRTNLSVIPVDALVQGGAGFVEGATDANAYMNLNQLMRDVYGASGSLDNDGNANLASSVTDQLAKEVQDRTDADQALLDNLASTAEAEGASLVGVVTDPNHGGLTVQAAITDLALRLVAAEEKVSKINNQEERYAFVVDSAPVEGTMQVDLPDSKVAQPNSLFISVNGAVQAPTINYTEILDGDNNVTGITFDPDVVYNDDEVFMWWKNV